ncbi:MAG: hypothetical protein ACP6IY_22105 [Promethearchaeia archaeon]
MLRKRTSRKPTFKEKMARIKRMKRRIIEREFKVKLCPKKRRK